MALRDVDVVMHLAARVHVMKDASADPLAEFRRVNVAGTEHLARQAARAGVKRLVYVSSIGVNGLSTTMDRPFSEADAPAPHNTYALSKWEAEQAYLVSDGEDVSTPELLRGLGEAMGRPTQLFPCPPGLLKLAGHVVGKSAQVERLLGSLRVDSGKIRRELGWTPPYTLQQGLQATAEWYRNVRGR